MPEDGTLLAYVVSGPNGYRNVRATSRTDAQNRYMAFFGITEAGRNSVFISTQGTIDGNPDFAFIGDGAGGGSAGGGGGGGGNTDAVTDDLDAALKELLGTTEGRAGVFENALEGILPTGASGFLRSGLAQRQGSVNAGHILQSLLGSNENFADYLPGRIRNAPSVGDIRGQLDQLADLLGQRPEDLRAEDDGQRKELAQVAATDPDRQFQLALQGSEYRNIPAFLRQAYATVARRRQQREMAASPQLNWLRSFVGRGYQF